MNSIPTPIDPISWWMFSIEAIAHLGTENLLIGFFFLAILASFLSLTLLTWAFSRGGIAWKNGRNQMGRVSIPGPRGLPLFGSLFSLSHGLPHRTLACMASSHAATKLMAFSLGSTPAVFGKRYDVACNNAEARELHEIVREGFELLGAFNWSDYLPWLSSFYDPFRIKNRCASLVPRVRKVVVEIIEEHRLDKFERVRDNSDFVDVLLSLDGEEKLELDDMVAVLWEMIFRGTDTTALLTEWVMAELVLNSDVQAKLRHELDLVVGKKVLTEADVANLPYLRAVVNETLRVHPPGPPPIVGPAVNRRMSNSATAWWSLQTPPSW
ncbi:hypothetical protein GBA52_026070 [Prunus armeniaca]|nr:hypothetical protein GBA52_026070 [Prunus armeniaca]